MLADGGRAGGSGERMVVLRRGEGAGAFGFAPCGGRTSCVRGGRTPARAKRLNGVQTRAGVHPSRLRPRRRKPKRLGDFSHPTAGYQAQRGDDCGKWWLGPQADRGSLWWATSGPLGRIVSGTPHSYRCTPPLLFGSDGNPRVRKGGLRLLAGRRQTGEPRGRGVRLRHGISTSRPAVGCLLRVGRHEPPALDSCRFSRLAPGSSVAGRSPHTAGLGGAPGCPHPISAGGGGPVIESKCGRRRNERTGLRVLAGSAAGRWGGAPWAVIRTPSSPVGPARSVRSARTCSSALGDFVSPPGRRG